MQERTNALLLTDDNSMVEEIRRHCPERYFSVVVHGEYSSLESRLESSPVDICFIDSSWANDDVGPLCRLLQAMTPQKGLPIVLLQYSDNVKQRVSGFESGLTDACTLPMDDEEFRSRLALQLRISKLEYEQAQVIDKLWHARQAAEDSSKKKGRFIEHLCNQLINEVNTIRSFAETQSSLEPIDIERGRERMLKKTSSVLELLLDTLDLTSIDSSTDAFVHEEILLRELVHSVAAEYALACSEKGLSFSCSVGESVPDVIVADEIRLRQVLHNVLDNAVKYTHEGSIRVEVSKGVVRKGEDPLRLYFKIEDSGKGIPPSLIPHITDPFGASGNVKLAGTGVGLALTSKILSLMDSQLHFDSVQGAGTTVSFSFIPVESHEVSTDFVSAVGAGVQHVCAVVFASSQLALQNTRRRLVQTGCTTFGFRPEDLETLSETVFVPDIVFVDASIVPTDIQKLIQSFGEELSAQTLWIVSTNEQLSVLPASFASRVEPALSTKHLYKVLSAVAPADVAESQMIAASISIAQIARWVSDLPEQQRKEIQESVDFLRHDTLESTLAAMEDGAERNTFLMNAMSANTHYLLQLGSFIETIGVE